MSAAAGKLVCAAVVALQIASIGAAHAAYNVCAAAANIHRQHVVCAAACPAGEVSIFSSAGGHPMCGTATSAAQVPAAPPPAAQAPVPEARAPQAPEARAAQARSCGGHWTDWTPRSRSVQNPCPSGCTRDSRAREQFRGTGRTLEHREFWECKRR